MVTDEDIQRSSLRAKGHRVPDDTDIVCPECKTSMAMRSGGFQCPNCGVFLTAKQALKPRNVRPSVASMRLEKLKAEGKITL